MATQNDLISAFNWLKGHQRWWPNPIKIKVIMATQNDLISA